MSDDANPLVKSAFISFSVAAFPIFIKSAINAITEILKKVGAKNDKEKYLVMAIENLQKGSSVIQSLLIFMLICNSFRTDSWSFNMMKDAGFL